MTTIDYYIVVLLAIKMEKGEEPIESFSRVDKIASTLASLVVCPHRRAT